MLVPKLGGLKLWVLVVVLAGCSSRDATVSLYVDESSTELRGWLDTRGELHLWPSSKFPYRYPDPDNGNGCVTLLNPQGLDVDVFHRKKVHLSGSSIAAIDLVDNSEDAPLPPRLVYLGRPVEDKCTRRWIFLIQSIYLDE